MHVHKYIYATLICIDTQACMPAPTHTSTIGSKYVYPIAEQLTVFEYCLETTNIYYALLFKNNQL